MKTILVFCLVSFSAVAEACPFCNSNTAKGIRASLFGSHFPLTLLAALLPFFIAGIILYMVYRGRFPFIK